MTLATALQFLSLVGSALMAGKLYRTGLFRKYPWFFGYFLFRIPNSIWPLFFSNFSDTGASLYFVLWVATEPITWFFHTAVVLELYRLVLERHKGLYTLGRWVMTGGLALSVCLSLLSLIPRMPLAMTEQKSRTMFWYLAMDRGLRLGLTIFLFIMMGFLVLYAVPISRNLKAHARIYTVFFLSSFLVGWLRSYLGIHSAARLNPILEVISVACIYAWIILLNPAGEAVRTTPTVFGSEYERRMLQHLDALNATMLKISSKSGDNFS